jgi:hypothetical protein
MAENVTLTNLANLQNGTTVVNTINNNNAVITSAFTDVLSRSGVSPNTMGAPLDMNSFPILNLPAPGSANSPARLQDIVNPNATINISLSLTGDATAPASSGALTTTVGKVNGVTYPVSPTTNTVPVVTGANTVTYQQVNTAQIANNAITATQLTNNTVGNAQIRQSTGLSVVGNTGTATANVADITGTTRQVLAVNTGGTGLIFAQPRGDQLLGTNTNDNATAGNVGEYISSTIVSGSAAALTTGTPINVTSISLTAGDWDVWGANYFIPTNTTSITFYSTFLTTTSGSTVTSSPGGFWEITQPAEVPASTSSFGGMTAGPIRFSLSTTTTIFLVAQANFTASTLSVFGAIQARRVR